MISGRDCGLHGIPPSRRTIGVRANEPLSGAAEVKHENPPDRARTAGPEHLQHDPAPATRTADHRRHAQGRRSRRGHLQLQHRADRVERRLRRRPRRHLHHDLHGDRRLPLCRRDPRQGHPRHHRRLARDLHGRRSPRVRRLRGTRRGRRGAHARAHRGARIGRLVRPHQGSVVHARRQGRAQRVARPVHRARRAARSPTSR